MSRRNVFLLGVSCVSGLFLLFFVLLSPFPRVCFGRTCLRVELARTPQEWQKGLMFRTRLPEGRGMLFVFPQEDFWAFWMKNTYIPLDILWLDSEGCVVDIVENAQPAAAEEPPSFRPVFRARYVLEANAGFVADNGIKPGKQARFKWIFLPKKL